MSHKDRRLQREQKEEAHRPRLKTGRCCLCGKVDPTSLKCPAGANGHIILAEERT